MPFWSRNTSNTPSTSTTPNDNETLRDPAATPAQTKTRDQLADEELSTLLSQLDAEHKARTKREDYAAGREFRREGKDTSFPTEMSCVTAFDELFYCYSVGGQLVNIYRYGSLRDCSEKGKKFRFCLKANWMHGQVARREKILAYHKEQAAKRRLQRNSEDVWGIRKAPIDNPFAEANTVADDYVE